jgi:hypothetical protein
VAVDGMKEVIVANGGHDSEEDFGGGIDVVEIEPVKVEIVEIELVKVELDEV